LACSVCGQNVRVHVCACVCLLLQEEEEEEEASYRFIKAKEPPLL
jgi:hypothetical protein